MINRINVESQVKPLPINKLGITVVVVSSQSSSGNFDLLLSLFFTPHMDFSAFYFSSHLPARDAEEREKWIEQLESTILKHARHSSGRVSVIL